MSRAWGNKDELSRDRADHVTEPQEPSRLEIRVGHAEREVAVNRLHSAFAEDRLDVTEFDQRVASAYAARTAGELAPLTADLPATAPVAWSEPASAKPSSKKQLKAERGREREAVALT